MNNHPKVDINSEEKVVRVPYNCGIPQDFLEELVKSGYSIQLVAV